MAALGITVLKNNAPWGPFTRAQLADGLALLKRLTES